MSRRNEEAIKQFLAAHAVGDVMDGTVHSIVSFGAFVEVAPEVQGLVHESDWQSPPEMGAQVRVRISAVDNNAARMSLVPA
jgi:small subunit ribosomal protein S1